MIRIQLLFKNGLTLTVDKPTSRETVDKVEEIMWRNGSRITHINVVARGLEMAEGARMRHYFNQIEFDLRIDQAMDRLGAEAFDLYEIAKHPRKRNVK